VRQQPGQPLLHPAPVLGLGIEALPQIANRFGLFGDPLMQGFDFAW